MIKAKVKAKESAKPVANSKEEKTKVKKAEPKAAKKETAKAKLENGVTTSSDYIRDLNAEDTAKQNLEIHKIQLLLAQYNYKITTGN